MKRNPITLITGGVLVLLFLLMLFTFQVRQTDIAVVTTFGKFSRSITNAGFNLRLPWPIQHVYKFDNRIQNIETKFEETPTRDAINVLATVFAGWQIVRPESYLESLNGDTPKAEQTLANVLQNVKNIVIAQHDFSDLVSTNEASLKFDQIEQEMLTKVQPQAVANYGIAVRFVGIKQLGLPESITARVFERMKAERQTRVKELQAQGDREATKIRAEADTMTNSILTRASVQAIEIAGAAEAKASEYYQVMQKNPELANFIFQNNALKLSLKNHATLVLDQQTPPFNMLSSAAVVPSATNQANPSKLP
jgi:modulator of FtsH protease HflC